MSDFPIKFRCLQCHTIQQVTVPWMRLTADKGLGGGMTAVVTCPKCGTQQKVTVRR
jgi:RNase P subunit RPR2